MKRSWLALTTALVGLAVMAVVVPSSQTAAQAVAENYTADTALQIGMLVQLDSKDPGKVVPALGTQADKVHGVIISPNDAPMSLSSPGDAQQVYVATANKYRVLVSDQNGPVHKDDYLTVSSIDGIGMKADGSQSTVIGKALSTFDGTGALSTTTVTDSNKQTHTVHIGYVNSAISIAHNPLQRSTSSNLPGFLQRASEAIADKPVSYARVYLSLAVLLVTAIIVGSLLYSAVRTSITSLGRNPLARAAISGSMVRVVLISLIILIAGLAGVYLLLKL